MKIVREMIKRLDDPTSRLTSFLRNPYHRKVANSEECHAADVQIPRRRMLMLCSMQIPGLPTNTYYQRIWWSVFVAVQIRCAWNNSTFILVPAIQAVLDAGVSANLPNVFLFFYYMFASPWRMRRNHAPRPWIPFETEYGGGYEKIYHGRRRFVVERQSECEPALHSRQNAVVLRHGT